MSFETIFIHRDLQVINGFVQLPPNNEVDKSFISVDAAEDALTTGETKHLSQGSGDQTGSKFGAQSFFRLPGLTVGSWYATDPVETLRDSV